MVSSRMADLMTLFPTRLYRETLNDPGLCAEIETACRVLALDDEAGQLWCQKNGYPGYTSYASLNDLPWRFPIFKALGKAIDKHVSAFAKILDFDLGRSKLVLDSLWVNILPEGGFHAAHIHPHSVISGTFYVSVPKGASALRLEDPRHAMMMAAPPKKAKAAEQNQSFVSIQPEPGTLLLWESWLRHDVPINRSKDERISVSFNYNWV
jgi:uncharacterized protein (TIGR02466 family)